MEGSRGIGGVGGTHAGQDVNLEQIRAAGGKGWARPMSEINDILAKHGHPAVVGAGDLNAFLMELRGQDLPGFKDLLNELLPNVDTEAGPGDPDSNAPGGTYLGF